MRYAICYDTLYVFHNKVEGNKFFTECYYMSEGAEQSRYAAILMGFANNSKIASDHSSNYCKEVAISSTEDENQFITITLDDFLSISDTVKYYESKIQPILKTSEEYKIHFTSKLPFQDFGSDDDCAYGAMYSLSNYYKDILEKQDLNVDKIITKNISDGKYEITINDDYVFETESSDNLNVVLYNVEEIIKRLKSKELSCE